MVTLCGNTAIALRRFRLRRHAFAWADSHGAAKTSATRAASSASFSRCRSIRQRSLAQIPRIASMAGERGFGGVPYNEMRCRVSPRLALIPAVRVGDFPLPALAQPRPEGRGGGMELVTTDAAKRFWSIFPQTPVKTTNQGTQ